MRYALLKDNVVINTIILQPSNLEGLRLDADAVICIEDNPEVGIGWLYKNNQFELPYQAPENT